MVIDPESVKIAISMVIREIENVIETDMFDTVEGECIYEDEYATPELEQNYIDLMECINYHFDVTCVKLEEVVERLNRLYDRVENAKTYSSSTTAYHSSIVSDAADEMNKAYKTYEAATKIRQAAMETAEREIVRTSAEAELKNTEYQTKHNEYISASNSSITQEKEDKLKVSNAYNIKEYKWDY